MFEKVKIPVCFACNDYRNGIFDDKVSALEIGNNALRLECNFADWSPRMRVEKGKIYIARRAFPYQSYTNWYGNWCWDRAILYGEDLINLLNWLKLKNWFSPEEGELRMVKVWERKDKFYADSDVAIFQKDWY